MEMKPTEQRTTEQVREHYEVEKELADRLRNATREERRRLYNVVYDERNRRLQHHPLVTRARDPEAQARAANPQVRLLQHFLRPETVFLEIGVGDCALALQVAKFVRKVYAVDVSEELIKGLSLPKNFEFCRSGGIGIPVPRHSVTVAYSNQMMEHLHEEDAFDQLRNIYNALAPGGIYVCVTPNRISGPHDISRDFDDVPMGFHLREYTNQELAEVFARAGFSDVKILVSYKGFVLSPLLSPAPFVWLERSLERAPRAFRKKLGYMLTAVKIVATK